MYDDWTMQELRDEYEFRFGSSGGRMTWHSMRRALETDDQGLRFENVPGDRQDWEMTYDN